MKRWMIGIFAATLAGCDADAPGATPLVMARDTAIEYVLAWSWEGARREGDAWVFETDLGYTVGISAAHLTLGTLALVPCEDEDEVVARAHGGGVDASTALGPMVESWLEQEPRRFGAAEASGADYCELYALSVPSEGLAAPDGVVLRRRNLEITGFWSAPGEATRRPLELSANLSDGASASIAGLVAWPAAASSGEVALVVTRFPARAFDGIELAAVDPVDLGFAALAGILGGAEVAAARRG